MQLIFNGLFYGLFVGLIASQSIMDLFTVLLVLILFYALLKESKLKEVFQISNIKWFLLPCLWFTYLVLDFIIKSPEKKLVGSLIREFIWLPLFPLLISMWSWMKLNKKFIQNLLAILSLGSAFAVFVFVIGFDPLTQNWSDRASNLEGLWRTGGFYSNAMALAQSYGPLLMIMAPFSIGILFSKEKKTPFQIIILTTFFITALAVLFTFTRGVWMALVISSIVGGFLVNRRLGVLSILFVVISAAILMISWPRFNERLFQAFDAKKSYDSERMVIWKTNWHIFKENPLLGIGYSENKRRLREYYDQLNIPRGQFEGHAHNQYLHFLAGTGIIGLLFYLIWCWLILKINYQIYRHYFLLKQKKLQYLFLGILLSQITFHIGALTESNFSIAKNRLLLVMIWSFIVYWSCHFKKPTTEFSSRFDSFQ